MFHLRSHRFKYRAGLNRKGDDEGVVTVTVIVVGKPQSSGLRRWSKVALTITCLNPSKVSSSAYRRVTGVVIGLLGKH